jgi:hypothetical protein
MTKMHLVSVHANEKLRERLDFIAEEFEFRKCHFDHVDDLEKEADLQALVAVLEFKEENKNVLAGQVQVLKMLSPNCYVILILGKKLNSDELDFVKKSGLDLVISDQDAIETSFLEFVLSQRISGSLVAVKGHDFKVDTVVNFKVLTMLPLNKKILPVILPTVKLQGSKYEKIKSSKELYIHRDDIEKVQNYSKTHQDLSAAGIIARCRLNYLNLCRAHTDLIVSLFDQSGQVTFSGGKEMLDQCAQIASEMLINLSTLADPWTIINNSTIGQTGSVERSPSVAAMAGLMALNLDGVNTEETILAGLLCEVGMISLHPSILKKVRHHQMSELTPEELKKYQKHPELSIAKCLEKKLPLTEKIKNIILCTHERFDRHGFPRNISPQLIPKESQLLQYSEYIDQKLIIKMGQENIKAYKLQMDALEQEVMNKKMLDVSMAVDLMKYLKVINDTPSAA